MSQQHPHEGWGDKCPKCNRDGQLLSTTNEWKNLCEWCDLRYNDKGEILEAVAK